MHDTTIRSALLVLGLFLAHCSQGPSEPTGAQSSAAEGSAVGSSIHGYQHTLANSKFHLGASPGQDTFSFYDRTVGSEGVFATNRYSGMVIATQNATSPARVVGAAGPYTMDETTHNQAVSKLFAAAGVPSDQILATGAVSKGYASGTPGTVAAQHFGGFVSTVTRQISGFPVPESFAEAELNANGETTLEVVYWPPIPAAVVADAKALASVLADPVRGPSYQSHLPVVGDRTKIAIHHVSGSIAKPQSFVAFASYDVSFDKGKTYHFDVNGRPLVLPQEDEESTPNEAVAGR